LVAHCKKCNTARHRRWVRENQEHVKLYVQEYRKKNRESIEEYSKAWKRENSEKVRQYQRIKEQRRARNPKWRISGNISARIRESLKDGKNGASWESLVGYTLEDLMAHLEAQFTKGMTWDNYGYDGWHIDHIRPISDFNFESCDDPGFKVCWSLWNLRPLWGAENIAKGASCSIPPLPLISERTCLLDKNSL